MTDWLTQWVSEWVCLYACMCVCAGKQKGITSPNRCTRRVDDAWVLILYHCNDDPVLWGVVPNKFCNSVNKYIMSLGLGYRFDPPEPWYLRLKLKHISWNSQVYIFKNIFKYIYIYFLILRTMVSKHFFDPILMRIVPNNHSLPPPHWGKKSNQVSLIVLYTQNPSPLPQCYPCSSQASIHELSCNLNPNY